MLYYAGLFLVIAVAAFIIGFLGNFIIGSAVFIAKICFFIFLALFFICFIMDIVKKRSKSK